MKSICKLDAIFRKIDELQNEIELNPQIKTNNEKIRYLGYVEALVKNFRSENGKPRNLTQF